MSAPLIVLSWEKKILSLLFQNNRLIQANAYPENSRHLGSVYIGKIKNIVPGLDAAFVEYQPGMMGFLPLKKAVSPLLTNRNFNGHLACGDELLVQVEREKIKNKVPGLTCNLSFSGKYSVITVGRQGIGYSSKLSSQQKIQLHDFLLQHHIDQRMDQEEVGLVVRTNAGERMDPALFLQELETLLQRKQHIRQTCMHRTCFSILYQPIPVWLEGIRDLYTFSYDKILTDDPTIFSLIQEYLPMEKRLSLYQDERISLEKLYNLKTRLEEALSSKVWLSNGAYLIIQQTEALTVIDVNSGKAQKQKHNDEFSFQINREASKEIAIQLKLRNLSGIIIIDFINHQNEEFNKRLLQELSALVKQDPVQTNVIDMTPLGLVEVTRRKISKPLHEQLKG